MSDSRSLPPSLSRGERIRRARALKGVSQRELARRSGIHYSNVCKYEKGRKVPRQVTLEAALTALDVQVAHSGALGALDRLLVRAPEGGQGPLPISFDPEAQAELLRGLARTVEQITDLALLKLGFAPAQLSVEPRPAAPRPETEEERLLAEARQGLWSPGFCLLLCKASENAAGADAADALDLAELARVIARRLRRKEPSNRRLIRLAGQTEAVFANASRVAGDYAAAEDAFARARTLWSAGEAGPCLVSEAWLLHLEASLRCGQRRFLEALDLHARALRKARPEETGALLLNRSATEVHLGNYEAALVTLAEAAPWIADASQPRLRWVLEYNRAMCLVRLARAAEAEIFVTEARRLADQLGNGLDLVNTRFLEGLTDAGLGRTELAIEKLEQVCDALAERGQPYDFALGGLDLALLYREKARWADIRKLANRMVGIFQERNIHRETIAAVILFKEAADNEAVTVELVRRLQEYLEEAQAAPGLRFE
jgi:transcriptional regulator with XRE-family HTH domain